MAKTLSDINLGTTGQKGLAETHSDKSGNTRDRRQAEKLYERVQTGGEGAKEAASLLKKPKFKSFLQDILDKKNEKKSNAQPTNKGLTKGLVKDPESEQDSKKGEDINQGPIKDELKKISILASKIVTIKFKNARLESKFDKTKQKKSGVSPLKKILGGAGKVVGTAAKFTMNVLGALGDLIGLAILNWMGDPANREAVKRLVSIFTGIIKFLSWFITGTISNLMGGFNQLISGRSWAEKLVGLFRAIAGLVGLKWLLNWQSIIPDIIWGFNRLKKWPSILKQLFKGGSRKSIDAIFQKHNSLLRTSLTRTFKRAFLRIFGTFGKRILRAFIKPLLRRVSGVPLIGPILAFLVNWVVFKEPPGRALFKAAGAGLGMAFVGTIASFVPIPILATWVGAMAGQLIGDWIGGALYDIFFSGGGKSEPVKASEDNEAGNIWDIIWKLARGVFGKIGEIGGAIVGGVVNAGKAVIGGAKKAAGWVGNKAKGAWNWLTGGGKKKDTYTKPEVNVMISKAVSETSQVSQMSKELTMDKKINERRKKTQATFVNINNRELTSIRLSVPTNDHLNNSGISDNRILQRI